MSVPQDDKQEPRYATNPVGIAVINAVAAGVVMSQAAIICDDIQDAGGECQDELAYAVVVGVIALLFDLIYICMAMTARASGTVTLVFSGFMFLWWIVGTGIMTFRDPFTGANHLNGYFASWIGFFTAAYLLFLGFAQARYAAAVAKSSAALGFCLLSSFIVMAQAATLCDNYCPEYVEYAIALSVISVVLCILLFMGNKLPGSGAQGFIIMFLSLWNLVGAIICTFHSPFTTFGNGYFGVWGMSISALLMVSTVRTTRNAQSGNL